MPANWIQIGRSNLFLKSDRLNWIVARRDKCEKSKSHPDGYRYADLTYHDKLSGAFERVYDEITKITSADSIEDILRICDETYAMLRRVLDKDFKDFKSAA